MPQTTNSPIEAVSAELQGVIGAQLIGVEYGLLKSDDEMEAGSAAMEIGGEIVVRFSNGKNIHFSWGGFPSGEQDWALLATPESSWTSLAKHIDASSLGPWPPVSGCQLVEAAVLGWNQAPSVVRLKFESGSVLVGIGSGGWFGDADSVMVRPDQSPFLDFLDPIKTTWSSQNVA